MSDTEAMIARRNRLLGPAYRLFYDEPLHLVKGKGVWLIDPQGRRYLDTYNNVPHVGHSHPAVVAAVQSQMAELNTHTRYLHDTILDYAETLLATFEPELDTAQFCCSGTEANELALRLARDTTGNKGVIVTECAYHGHSQAIYEISTRDVGVEGLPDYAVSVPAPDLLRGPHQGTDALARYVEHIAKAVETLNARGHGVAAMIVDTIQSSGGTVVPPLGYYRQAAEIVRQAGGLFIADEVQAGFGRTGTDFWVYQGHDVVPDFVTLGKPMGNGMPLAGCITQRAHVEGFAKSHKYFNTFAGIPVSCAAGLAVLNVLEQENLQASALDVGNYLKAGIAKLAGEHDVIGDVRGSGFFIGLDLVTDRQTMAPATAFTKSLIEAMKERNVLSGAIGPDMNILKIRPPMVLTRDHADLLLDVLAESLKSL
ncbi:MAG: aminotransferase class III-fold pyridoxal phosphate-dependent enzyme [Rhodospirillaceae bacterium]|jgi:4-aminobutyrate aminotransferase-like enzyme|nr:aminotransferase class III-fold pyridoxal phosphate-dependent enzyme [Rhodospirillaceae bacterium]MBT6206047.1 aminotransferase class III-fold pyridoxal phosphate-dependent enzyme [Rhodospirillaceae bacterium]MBT7649225.1 aminotransferase class III-fold pyridoxal phosphate-dependent enzyme [Rhodospirillaceae bacterium]